MFLSSFKDGISTVISLIFMYNSNNISNKKIINFFFSLIFLTPLFIYIGPAIENISLVIILIVSLYLTFLLPKKNEIFFYKYKQEMAFLIIFVFFIIISILLNTKYITFNTAIKIPYFFLIIVTMILINEISNDNYFFPKKLFNKINKILLFLIYFLIFDIFFQKFFDYNIFGFVYESRVSSFFRDELVAGSYLAKISPVFLFLHRKKIIGNIQFYITSVLLYLAISITQERSALLIFLSIFGFYIFYIFFSRYKLKHIFLLLIPIFVLMAVGFSFNKNRILEVKKVLYHKSYLKLSHSPVIYYKDIKEINFYQDITKKINMNNEVGFYIDKSDKKKVISFKNLINDKIKNLNLFINFSNFNENSTDQNFIQKKQGIKDNYVLTRNLDSNNYSEILLQSDIKVQYNYFDSGWGSHTLAALEMFKESLIFGTGPDSFRHKCFEEKFKKVNTYNIGKVCTTHPHNLHIEILQGLGVVGYLGFILYLIAIFKIQTAHKNIEKIDKIILFVMIISFFPLILPSGSFFSSAMINKIFFTFLLIQIINNYSRSNQHE